MRSFSLEAFNQQSRSGRSIWCGGSLQSHGSELYVVLPKDADTGVAGRKCEWASSSKICPSKKTSSSPLYNSSLILSPLSFTLPRTGCLFKRGLPEAAFHPSKRAEVQTQGEQLPVFLDSAAAWLPAPLRPSGARPSRPEVERPGDLGQPPW